MFVSQESSISKKAFQKPNILRRKQKGSITKPNISHGSESPGTKSPVSAHDLSKSDLDITRATESSTPTITNTHIVKLSGLNNNNIQERNIPQETEIAINNLGGYVVTSHFTQSGGVVNGNGQSSLNLEAFISNKRTPKSKVDKILPVEKKSAVGKTKWCLEFADNGTDGMLHSYNMARLTDIEQKPNIVVEKVPSVIITSVNQLSSQSHKAITSAPNRAVSVELISNKAVKFKCDELDCNKGFWSEERLRKHKNSHKRQSSTRPPSQIILECPVKKVLDDGFEEKCPRTFQVRRELLHHLNTDHTPEDALHRCEVCGRRFFWAGGLRAHAQSVCARGGLACSWPGCGRVFRLPCRLREHTRAHTGDRPYLCRYPECGWAFRSASKLVRHARRHTDERRHACGVCGRAFLRREHLRDHVSRHHLPTTRGGHRCAHAGCEQSFTNMRSLYMHTKKVHRKHESDTTTSAITDDAELPSSAVGENVYVVSVVADSNAEWHSARTHCTWPLPSRASSLTDLSSTHHDTEYVLEEDVQVENAEGSTSNVYTVRSDLFLHGNVPVDDDSQNITAEIADSSEAAVPLDTDLCLDSHPTIDLMPEGLMYEDAAVDESSFRVFLMNGEELTL